MVVILDPQLEAALSEQAALQGISPEKLAIEMLRASLLSNSPPEPRDDWERRLLSAARPWGMSHPDAALGSEGIYD